MAGIYIHIPFCKQACSYCDFYFITRQEYRSAFVGSLLQEIQSRKDSRYSNEPIETIYFGGGTPSRLTLQDFGRIFWAFRESFDLSQLREVTVEMNPDDVTPSFLHELQQLGVNRASMGIQSFQPRLLSFMHRAHTAGESILCMEYLKQAEFDSYSVDLIYGNPNEMMSDLDNDLDLLLRYPPPHVSAYSLTIEPKTRLGKLAKLGRLQPMDDDRVASQFDRIAERLKGAGLEHYEVSNYGKPGHKSLHNSNYWTHVNYLGFGPSAHSFWWDEDMQSARRWSNAADFKSYVNSDKIESGESEQLDLRTLAEERIMLGLRTRNGIGPDVLQRRYTYSLNDEQKAFVSSMKSQGYLKRVSELACTDKGLRMADRLTLELISRGVGSRNQLAVNNKRTTNH